VTTAFLIVAVFGALCALNAYFPTKNRFLLLPSFMASWLTIELAPWLLFWEALGVAFFVWTGALDDTMGWVALLLAGGTAGALVAITAVARRTRLILNDTCADLDLGDAPPFPKSQVFFPLVARRRKGVTIARNITFARYGKKKLKLDVVKAVDARPGDRRPGILQVHGGGWVIGDKREQGIPLLLHLAANGWVGINANYRLSPRAAFPDHLVDLKKAIAWYREHAEEHGADPNYLCVTGGSAGGHLCALVALTANDPEYQPGFEDVDTSVKAAVPFYGVYDFTNRNSTWHRDTMKRFFEPMVMKKRYSKDPEAFAKASPMDQVRKDAPPFLIIHGDLDTLAPVADAREFVRLLDEVSDEPVLYVEMKGAQHAFDVFPSYRTARVIEAVERFLHNVHERRPMEDLVDAESATTAGSPS
jgi:acetyl esterase/lipase